MKHAIREATTEDYTGLCALYAEGDAFHAMALPDVFRKSQDPARSREYVDAVLLDADAIILVAENHDALVGLAEARIVSSGGLATLAPRRYARIDNIVVRQEHRSAGIGKALLDRVHRWALEKGVSDAQLNVWEFNRQALDFYEKLGYTTANRLMWRALK